MFAALPDSLCVVVVATACFPVMVLLLTLVVGDETNLPQVEFMAEISRLLALWRSPSALQRPRHLAAIDAKLLSHVLRTLGRSVPAPTAGGRCADGTVLPFLRSTGKASSSGTGLRKAAMPSPWLTAKEMGKFIVDAWVPVGRLRRTDPSLMSQYLALNLRFVSNLQLHWAAEPVADSFRLAWHSVPRLMADPRAHVRAHGGQAGSAATSKSASAFESSSSSSSRSGSRGGTATASQQLRDRCGVVELLKQDPHQILTRVHETLVCGLLARDGPTRRRVFEQWYKTDLTQLYQVFQTPQSLTGEVLFNAGDEHDGNHNDGCGSGGGGSAFYSATSSTGARNVSFYTVLKSLFEYDWAPLAGRSNCNFLPIFVDVILLELGKSYECRTNFSRFFADVASENFPFIRTKSDAFGVEGRAATGGDNFDAASLLTAVRSACYHHPSLATKVLLQVTPSLWSQFGTAEQKDLVTSIVSLLSRPWLHASQDDPLTSAMKKSSPPTPTLLDSSIGGGCREVVLTVLSLCGVLAPRPAIPSALLIHLADQHQCWYSVAPLITDNIADSAFRRQAGEATHNRHPSKPTNNGNDNNVEEQADAAHVAEANHRDAETVVSFRSLTRVYSRLHADDLVYGVHRHFSTIADARHGLALESQGYWERARQAFAVAIAAADKLRRVQQATSGSSRSTSASAAGHHQFHPGMSAHHHHHQQPRQFAPPVTQHERDAWQQHWVTCAKQLGDWKVLQDFAVAQQNDTLQRECHAKLGNWGSNLLQQIPPPSAFLHPSKGGLSRVHSFPSHARQRVAAAAAAAAAVVDASPRALLSQL